MFLWYERWLMKLYRSVHDFINHGPSARVCLCFSITFHDHGKQRTERESGVTRRVASLLQLTCLT